MANFSTWTSQQPSGSSSIRDSDEVFRSNQSIVEATLNTEHYFNSSSKTSAGIHLPGAGRMFFGTRASLVTPASADSAGRLYHDTTSNTLLGLTASSVVTLASVLSSYGCRYSVTTSYNIAIGVNQLFFDTSNFDQGAISTALLAGASLFTIPAAGRYLVSVNVHYQSAVTGGRSVLLYKNGGLVAQASGSTADPGVASTAGVSLTFVDKCASGDTFGVAFAQDSGVSLAVYGASPPASFLAIQQV